MQIRDTLRQDIRWTWRTWRRAPAFSLAALTTLALGLGAATALFSVCDRLLFRSLPYPDADRLVSVGLLAPLDSSEFLLSPDYVTLWRETPAPFESATTVTAGTAPCDLLEERPARLSCAFVEINLLPVLGLSVAAGRNFTAADANPGSQRAALITHALWTRRYAADPASIGRLINLDGRPALIVGVLPPNFEMPTLSSPDVLLPQQLPAAASPQNMQFLRGFARLKPGVTEQAAFRALQPLFQQMLRNVPPAFRSEVRLRVRSLRDRQLGDTRRTAWLLLAAVGALLLIACTNVANLLLARSAARRNELAIRAALGAGRARLARLALTESALLAVVGTAIGLGIAQVLLRTFIALAPGGVPRLRESTLDLRVILAFAALASIAALLTGVAPAVATPGAEALHGTRTVNSIRLWTRTAFVVAQIALTFALVGTSALLLRSLWAVQSAPLGMDTARVVTTTVTLNAARYPSPEAQREFFERLLDQTSAIPGVEYAALSDSLPPSGSMRSMIYSLIEVAGRPLPREGTGGMVAWRQVTPGYFQALGIRILRGRGFIGSDRTAPEPAMILSQSLERKLFPGESALGKRIRTGRGQYPWHTVVGIAADARNAGLTTPAEPEYYVIRTRSPRDATRRGSIVIRSQMPPRMLSTYLRQVVAAMDRELPIDIQTMETRVAQLAARPRFLAFLLSTFGALALIIATTGLAGVAGYLVTERTRDIGVRMAIGATPGNIARDVFREAAVWCGGGLLFGAGLIVLFRKALSGILYETPSTDAISWTGTVLLLIVVSIAAALGPALRASRVDPASALRSE